MQEACQTNGDPILIPLDVTVGANIRRAGSQVMATGTRLAL